MQVWAMFGSFWNALTTFFPDPCGSAQCLDPVAHPTKSGSNFSVFSVDQPYLSHVSHWGYKPQNLPGMNFEVKT